ncbi:hypothetical protein BVY02_00740 [bacterium J17]|nr:hypothetical protein BVY02_00740 [bacterium J17]
MSETTATDQLRPIFLKLPPDNIVQLKFTLESYEGLGILRTLDSDTGEVVILALEDTLADVESLLESIKGELGMRKIEAPESLEGDWLLMGM